MTFSTANRVSGRTRRLPLTTRETVIGETPARLATSRTVALFILSRPRASHGTGTTPRPRGYWPGLPARDTNRQNWLVDTRGEPWYRYHRFGRVRGFRLG